MKILTTQQVENIRAHFKTYTDPPERTKVFQLCRSHEALRNASQWQPIETAPKDGTRIMLCENRESFQGYWDRETEDEGGQCWRLEGLDMDRCEPTHWMRLPDAPATQP